MWKSLSSYDVSLACHCVYEHRTIRFVKGKIVDVDVHIERKVWDSSPL